MINDECDISKRKVTLYFDEGLADQNYLPAKELSESIAALNRTVEITALSELSQEMKIRERMPEHLRKEFSLYFAAPRSGSFVLSGILGGYPSPLIRNELIDRIADKFNQSWNALYEGDWVKLEELYPDASRLRRWIQAAAGVSPKPGKGLHLTIELSQLKMGLKDIPKRITAFEKRQKRQESSINGYLSEIDFMSHTFKLRYPCGNRLIEGSYSDDVEDFLLANPRELIQVSAEILYSADDVPVRILRATAFNILDLTSVVIDGFETKAGYIEAANAIEIPVTLDEDQQYIVVSFPELQMELAARNRDELITLIEEDIEALWRNIVCSDDESLAEDSMAVKKWMMEHFRGGKCAA
jgi:hypothetical protein